MLNDTWRRWVQNVRQTLWGNHRGGLVRRQRRPTAILRPELLATLVFLTPPTLLSIARPPPFPVRERHGEAGRSYWFLGN